MANKINKIVYNSEPIIDFTEQTCDSSKVLQRETFFDKSGELQTGTIPSVEGGLKIPSEQQTTVIPAKSYVTSDVVLPEAPKPEDILQGVTIYGIKGTASNGMEDILKPQTDYDPNTPAFWADCVGFNQNGLYTVPNYLFYNNTYLKSFLPWLGITGAPIAVNFGKYCFYNCSSLNMFMSIAFTDIIYDYAFFNCRNLNFRLGDSQLYHIGPYAFYNTVSFTNNDNTLQIINPTELTKGTGCVIGNYAFYNSGLQKFSIGLQANYIQLDYINIGANSFEQAKVTHGTIYGESSPCYIGKEAFKDTSNFNRLDIYTNGPLTEIDVNAFYNSPAKIYFHGNAPTLTSDGSSWSFSNFKGKIYYNPSKYTGYTSDFWYMLYQSGQLLVDSSL